MNDQRTSADRHLLVEAPAVSPTCADRDPAVGFAARRSSSGWPRAPCCVLIPTVSGALWRSRPDDSCGMLPSVDDELGLSVLGLAITGTTPGLDGNVRYK